MKNMPCIIGVAQKTWRLEQGDAPQPLQQWDEVARQAASDCGNAEVLSKIDDINVIYSLSWNYDDAPTQLATQLGITGPFKKRLSGLSGTSPQKFLHDAAEHIMQGKSSVALVVGGEALATKKKAKKEDRKLPWPKPQSKPVMPFDDPFHPSEVAHQIFQAYLTFAMLDSARRHQKHLSLQQNREQQCEMMAKLSQVAAHHPDAWFPKAHTAASLLHTEGSNRLVAYPYSKLQMAFMDVDMAAALLVTSHEKADELGIAPEKRVYLHGWSYAREPVHLAERPELWHSPAMEIASEQALQMAAISSQSLTHLDLYSCFPASLNFARDALGINDQDPRSLTVTGGLPYFGGPGNNYTAHALVSMTETLRRHPGDFGLVNGVGMHLTNHSFGIYSTSIPQRALLAPDYQKAQHYVESYGKKPIESEAGGEGTVVAYSIIYGADKNTAYAICELTNGNRCYAICDDQQLVARMQQEEWVGKVVTLRCENKINHFQ